MYQIANLPQDYEMTPQEFVNLVANTNDQFQLLKKVIDDSCMSNPNQYTATQMASLLTKIQPKVFIPYMFRKIQLLK